MLERLYVCWCLRKSNIPESGHLEGQIGYAHIVSLVRLGIALTKQR